MRDVAAALEAQSRDIRGLIAAVRRTTKAYEASFVRDPRDSFQRGPDDPRARDILRLSAIRDPRDLVLPAARRLSIRQAPGVPLPAAGPGVRVATNDPRLAGLLVLTRFRWVRVTSAPFPGEPIR